MRKTYVQDETGKFVEKSQRQSRLYHLQLDSGDFVSPVTGQLVSGNRALREHNKRHGVTNDLDQLREAGQREVERSKNIRPAGTVHERKLQIKDAIDRASSSGYHRRVQYDE